MGTREFRTAVGILAFTVLAAAAVLAQSAQSAPTDAPDPLLGEMRALRADLNQRLEATMRMQLLVARLQLQEQRTSTVINQLRDIEARLRENEATKQQTATMLQMLGMANLTEAEKKENPFFGMFAESSEKLSGVEAELRQQQADLMRQLADEQARWTAFNAQLDQLEQLFAPKK